MATTTSKPTADAVPVRRRGPLADALQRALGVLPESGDPGDRALRRDVLHFCEELRGLRKSARRKPVQ
jgi:hypothetical protein